MEGLQWLLRMWQGTCSPVTVYAIWPSKYKLPDSLPHLRLGINTFLEYPEEQFQEQLLHLHISKCILLIKQWWYEPEIIYLIFELEFQVFVLSRGWLNLKKWHFWASFFCSFFCVSSSLFSLFPVNQYASLSSFSFLSIYSPFLSSLLSSKLIFSFFQSFSMFLSLRPFQPRSLPNIFFKLIYFILLFPSFLTKWHLKS